MNAPTKFEVLEVGYNVAAAVGMDEKEIQTPSGWNNAQVR